MSRFAKINEEVFRRYDELTGEEYRLYSTIVYHTFVDTGICRRNLRQMALAHGLDYIGTTKRFKKLVKLGWCEKTDKGIRPLVNLNVAKKTTFENVAKMSTFEDEMLSETQHDSCQKDNIDVAKKTTFEDEMLSKRQHTYKGIIEPFKDQNFPRAVAAEKNAAAAAASNGHQSRFSIEDCLRYAEICVLRGEPIKNPHGLAMTAYQTGAHDVFIQARLYPEKPETVSPAIPAETQTAEETDFDFYEPEPLSMRTRETTLASFRVELANRGAQSLSCFKDNYLPEDWAWLQEQLKTG